MSDTQRTRTAILALLADNVTGNISAQDVRDFVVTVMEADFVNPGDFWTQPKPAFMISDKTIKGWIDYSQIILSDISFGRIAYLGASGWAPASLLTSGQNQLLGVAGNSYIAGESQAQILRKGLIYDSALSARFSGQIGKLIYLQSGSAYGSISVQLQTSVKVVGFVELSAFGDVTSGKWRFEPEWSVKGV
jgi:hypothetical protein